MATTTVETTSVNAINVGTIELSMYKDTTLALDNYRKQTDSPKLTANVYTLEGVTWQDGSLRQLSIGELVMALCLQRASELEAEIIEMMQEMEKTTARLEELSDYESRFIENLQSKNVAYYYIKNDTADYKLLKDEGILSDQEYLAKSTPLTINGTTIDDSKVLSYDDLITKIEAKMDEKNSFSQEKMIELQSYTNKRDQSYDMISNILKSLNTVLIGNVNNM